MTARSDDELMLIARGGGDEAFEVLVTRYQRRVIAVASRLLRQKNSLVPDVAQDTFLAIYRAKSRYQPRGKFYAYLYQVLLNQCRTACRSAQGEHDALVRAAYPLQDGGVHAESVVLALERQRQVQAALESLSPKLKDVVVLRYFRGLAYEEIADELAKPVGTVKRRQFDAIEMLRRKLEGA